MKNLNICIRKVKHGDFKNTIDIVLLDDFEDRFNSKFACFGFVGASEGAGYCHSSGDYSYFRDSTVKAEKHEYENILKSFLEIYSDYEIVIHERLTKKFAA